MTPSIDHIHVTVADITRAEGFYDRLLPILGFDLALKEKEFISEYEYCIVEYHHRNFSFGIVNPRKEYDETVSRRKAGALHHLAFRAESKDEVDAVFLQVKELNTVIVHEPQYYAEYCPDYYAFFFKDSENIEYEVVSFDREGYFP